MITIKVDNLSDGRVMKLLARHREEMHAYSPADSIYAVDVSQFQHDSITF